MTESWKRAEELVGHRTENGRHVTADGATYMTCVVCARVAEALEDERKRQSNLQDACKDLQRTIEQLENAIDTIFRVCQLYMRMQ